MPCTILCAADLWGTKVNYELPFSSPPTSAELQLKVENVFAPEHAARRPADVPPTQGFVIERMQTFDERAQQWVDLLTPAQLQDYSQVYLFQKESEYHREVQSKIPPPIPAPITRALPITAQHTGPKILDNYSSLTAAAAPSPPSASPGAAQIGTGTLPVPPIPARPVVPAQPTLPPAPSMAPAPLASATLAPAPPAPAAVSMPAASVVPPAKTATLLASQSGRTIPFSEKQRCVFDELDTRKARAIELEEFRAAFQRLRVDYPTITCNDMFQKADANHDNQISYEEWRTFSELYPTLLDSLYFRTKDYWTDVSQQQDIEAAKAKLDEAREKEKEARMSCMQAQADTSGQEQKRQVQMAAVQEAQAREAEAKAILEAAHDDTERGRGELRDRVIEQNQQKDKERQKQVGVMEAQREVESAQRKLALNEAECVKAEEVLREMERRVTEQRREVDRHHGLVDKSRGELATAQGSEHLANIMLTEAQKDTQGANDRVALAEADVASKQEREREATQVLRDSQNDSARQLAKRDMEDRELQMCKEREAAKVQMEEDAVRLVEEHEKLTQALEHENMELNVKRRQVEEEERPLLEQELKLRELRDSLEENEARLRMDHRSFHSAHGRGGTAADTTQSPIRTSPARTHALTVMPSTALPPPPTTVPLVPMASTGSPYRSIAAAVPPLPARVSVSPSYPAVEASASLAKFESAPALSSIPPPATRGMSPAGTRI